jgi:hypothetical protein
MIINQEVAEKIRLIWTNFNEEEKSKIINLIKKLNNTTNNIDNVTIKKHFGTILALIEEKLLVNLEKENSAINFKKINNIVNNNNIVSNSIFTDKQLNNIVQKINTLDASIKDYLVKSVNNEYKNYDGNIILLFQNIINDLIELLIK